MNHMTIPPTPHTEVPTDIHKAFCVFRDPAVPDLKDPELFLRMFIRKCKVQNVPLSRRLSLVACLIGELMQTQAEKECAAFTWQHRCVPGSCKHMQTPTARRTSC